MQSRRLFPLFIAALLSFSAHAQDSLPKARWGEHIGSVHALMGQATALAKKWDPRAKLLGIIGNGPAVEAPAAPEEWSVAFEVVDHPSLVSHALFRNGSIVRSGPDLAYAGATDDFPDLLGCFPINIMFLDTPKIIAQFAKNDLAPMEYHHRYSFSLIRPRNDYCGAMIAEKGEYGSLEMFSVMKPFPKAVLDKVVWVGINDEEALFLDAKTGKTLARKRYRSHHATQAPGPDPGD